MVELELLTFGTGRSHDRDFVYDRPNGVDNWLLLCFSTPFRILTRHGFEDGKPGDCILFAPGDPQHHSAADSMESGYINDWIHFRGEVAGTLATRYGLPVGELLPTGNSHILTAHLKQIRQEQTALEPYWREKILTHMEQMMLEVARAAALYRENARKNAPYHRSGMIRVRRTVLDDYGGDWDVPRMAALAGLSPSRFTALYRRLFGTSPKDDLIARRLEEAKILLHNSDLPVQEIAYRCGFHSAYYFAQLFRKKTGYSATEYRGR